MKRVIGIAAVLMGIYIGAYFSLVKRAQPAFYFMGFSHWPATAEYRHGGKFAELLFQPIQIADTHVRVRYWTWTDEDVIKTWGPRSPEPTFR